MPLNVFITVDTEVWPRHADWRETSLREDLRRDLYGVTPEGEFGVPYQMDVLDHFGLKAVFFVESLFPCAVGIDPLKALVSQIRSRGHEVQLHLHTEWLSWIDPPLLPGRLGNNLNEFTEEEQTLLLSRGVDNLRAAGVQDVCAFRAGNYGANFDTLRALSRQGIQFDSSHNTCYLRSTCHMRTPAPLLQPARLEEVWEFPVSFFGDWPGHYRHAQLCACSSQEMTGALMQAWEAGWYSFVIVSHSNELIRGRKQTAVPPLPDHTVIARFNRLCEFLAEHRDKFRTTTFSELPARSVSPPPVARPLRSKLRLTAGRLVEQLARRLCSSA
jgi:hypothetical protein